MKTAWEGLLLDDDRPPIPIFSMFDIMEFLSKLESCVNIPLPMRMY